MKELVIVLLLACFVSLPIQTLWAEPFCDWALETGRFVDWLVCMVFAMILDEGAGDYQGNWSTGG